MNRLKSPRFLLQLWNRVHGLPGGKIVFGKALAYAVPYSQTIEPEVLELRPGFARLRMRDQRKIRNHLGSVHAIALANLAELTSGLALTCGLPQNARGILKSFSIDYVKKGRGAMIAESRATCPTSNERQEVLVEVETQDSYGYVVSRAKALWLIGPSTGSLSK